MTACDPAATHCGEFESGLRSAVSVYFDDFFRRCYRELGSQFSFDFGLFFLVQFLLYG